MMEVMGSDAPDNTRKRWGKRHDPWPDGCHRMEDTFIAKVGERERRDHWEAHTMGASIGLFLCLRRQWPQQQFSFFSCVFRSFPSLLSIHHRKLRRGCTLERRRAWDMHVAFSPLGCLTYFKCDVDACFGFWIAQPTNITFLIILS